MALVVKDRVKETTTTTGTGSISLGGAVTKFKTFSSALSNADTTYYAIEQQGNTNEFEIGIGTYTSSGNTLARTTILSSSNSNNAVDLSAGTKNIFITYPADKAVYEDASNNISVVDDAKIKFGTGDDLEIYHDSSSNSSYIKENGSGHLIIQGQEIQFDNASGTSLVNLSASQVEILHGGSKKLETESTGIAVTGNITVSGTVDGRDLATDGTKLDGIEASADVTDTANVTSAGALMDSEVTNLAEVKAFNSSDYATAAQGTTADAAMPKSGGTFSGDVTFDGASVNGDMKWDQSANKLKFYNDAILSIADTEISRPSSNEALWTTMANLSIRGHDLNLYGWRTVSSDHRKGLVVDGTNGTYLYYPPSEAVRLQTTQSGITVTGAITVSGTVDGRDLAADGSKLDGIQAGATAGGLSAEEAEVLAIALG